MQLIKTTMTFNHYIYVRTCTHTHLLSVNSGKPTTATSEKPCPNRVGSCWDIRVQRLNVQTSIEPHGT